MENSEKKFICIRCPKGCEVITSLDGHGQIMEIKGNSCRLGQEYVKAEISDPRRTLTTTVRVNGGSRPLVPVWTEKPVPKDKVLDLARELRDISVNAPVDINQIVLENALNMGINVITSGKVPVER